MNQLRFLARLGNRGSLILIAALVLTNIVTLVGAQGDGISKVHACAKNSTGAVRILLNPTDTCSGNEIPVEWVNNVTAGPGLTSAETSGNLTLSAILQGVTINGTPRSTIIVDSGTVMVTTTNGPTASNLFYGVADVTFSHTFTAPPMILLTAVEPQGNVTSAVARDVTTNGITFVQIWSELDNTTATVYWIAYGH
jgi:hypothetical protein